MIKESCSLIGLLAKLATHNQNWQSSTLSLVDGCIHAKDLRYCFVASRDIGNQKNPDFSDTWCFHNHKEHCFAQTDTTSMDYIFGKSHKTLFWRNYWAFSPQNMSFSKKFGFISFAPLRPFTFYIILEKYYELFFFLENWKLIYWHTDVMSNQPIELLWVSKKKWVLSLTWSKQRSWGQHFLLLTFL